MLVEAHRTTDNSKDGTGVKTGTLEYTMALRDAPRCEKDEECQKLCQKRAITPEAFVTARCVKLVGEEHRYCCCYRATTTACCHDAFSDIDCWRSVA